LAPWKPCRSGPWVGQLGRWEGHRQDPSHISPGHKGTPTIVQGSLQPLQGQCTSGGNLSQAQERTIRMQLSLWFEKSVGGGLLARGIAFPEEPPAGAQGVGGGGRTGHDGGEGEGHVGRPHAAAATRGSQRRPTDRVGGGGRAPWRGFRPKPGEEHPGSPPPPSRSAPPAAVATSPIPRGAPPRSRPVSHWGIPWDTVNRRNTETREHRRTVISRQLTGKVHSACPLVRLLFRCLRGEIWRRDSSSPRTAFFSLPH